MFYMSKYKDNTNLIVILKITSRSLRIKMWELKCVIYCSRKYRNFFIVKKKKKEKKKKKKKKR
jgi:hypothetical protein